jgi:hypothetical protein
MDDTTDSYASLLECVSANSSEMILLKNKIELTEGEAEDTTQLYRDLGALEKEGKNLLLLLTQRYPKEMRLAAEASSKSHADLTLYDSKEDVSSQQTASSLLTASTRFSSTTPLSDADLEAFSEEIYDPPSDSSSSVGSSIDSIRSPKRGGDEDDEVKLVSNNKKVKFALNKTSDADDITMISSRDPSPTPKVSAKLPPKPTSSYSSAIKGVLATTNSDTDMEITPANKYLRFRFAYKPSKDANTDASINGEKKRIMSEILNICKEVDPRAKLVTWSVPPGQDSSGLNCSDVASLNPVNSSQYIDTKSSGMHVMIKNQTVFRIGIRIQTSWDLNEFHDSWKNAKRKCDMGNKRWFIIYPAETQRFETSHLVGFCMGSTENQYLGLLNSKIEKDLGVHGVECSSQAFNQSGISNLYWEKADSYSLEGKRKNSPGWKRDRFKMAPRGVVIYAQDESKVALLRKLLCTKYGKNDDDGKWKVWPDGSEMRFCPIQGKRVMNKKTEKQIYKRMGVHIHLKAHAVTLETPLLNAGSEEIFNDTTIMQAVLAQTAEVEGKPTRIFAHLAPMWSRDKDTQKWGVVVHQQLVQAAAIVLSNLEENLTKIHGPDIKKFFRSKQQSTNTSRSRFPETTVEDSWFSDEEDESLATLSGSKGMILLEGMDAFINNTKTSEIPSVFTEDNSLNQETIGSMGEEAKTEETEQWTVVENSRKFSKRRQAQKAKKKVQEVDETPAVISRGTESDSMSSITWCNSIADTGLLRTMKKRIAGIHKLLTAEPHIGLGLATLIMRGDHLGTKDLMEELVLKKVGYAGDLTSANIIASAYFDRSFVLTVIPPGGVNPQQYP